MVVAIKIRHEQKHKMLKSLAEAGYAIVSSDLEAKKKFSLYDRLKKIFDGVYWVEDEDECTCEVERETEETMSVENAVNALSNGHGLMEPKEAGMICKAVGVPYRKSLEEHWYSDWSDPKGMHMFPGQEGSIGIWSLTLSAYVAGELGVKEKAGSYIGRGFQAQAYSREIAKVLLPQSKVG